MSLGRARRGKRLMKNASVLFSVSNLRGRKRWGSCGTSLSPVGRQKQTECTPPVRLALNCNSPTAHFNDCFGYGQPQAVPGNPASAFVRSVESVKNMAHFLICHADTTILAVDHSLVVYNFDTQRNRAVFMVVFDRIVNDIGKKILQSFPIAGNECFFSCQRD